MTIFLVNKESVRTWSDAAIAQRIGAIARNRDRYTKGTQPGRYEP